MWEWLNRFIRRRAQKQARDRWEAGDRQMVGIVPTERKIRLFVVLFVLAGAGHGGMGTFNLAHSCRAEQCAIWQWGLVFLQTPFWMVFWGFVGYLSYKRQQLQMLEFQALGGRVVPRDPIDQLENARAATLIGLVGAAGILLLTLIAGLRPGALISGIATAVLAAILVVIVRAKRRRTER